MVAAGEWEKKGKVLVAAVGLLVKFDRTAAAGRNREVELGGSPAVPALKPSYAKRCGGASG